MKSIVNFKQGVIINILLIILQQLRPLSCTLTPQPSDMLAKVNHLIQAIKKTEASLFTDASAAMEFLISAEVRNSYKEYHEISASDKDLQPATKQELDAVYMSLIARSESGIEIIAGKLDSLWRISERKHSDEARKKFCAEVKSIITPLINSKAKIEDNRILIASVDLLFRGIISSNDPEMDTSFAAFWNLNIKPHITTLVNAIHNTHTKLSEGKEGFDAIVAQVPKLSAPSAEPLSMDLLKTVAESFFAWRLNMHNKAIADQLLTTEDRKTLFTNWPFYLHYISQLNYDESDREASVEIMNNYVNAFKPLIENSEPHNLCKSLYVAGAQTLLALMEDRSKHSIKKPMVLPSIVYFSTVTQTLRPDAFVKDTDVVGIRFHLRGLIDAYYQVDCQWNDISYEYALIRDEDDISIQIHIAQEYVTKYAALKFPENKHEIIRAQIFAYFKLLTVKLEHIGATVTTESIEVAIGILKDLEAEYMKSWFMELRPSYGSFKIDVNNIAVAKRISWPKELQ